MKLRLRTGSSASGERLRRRARRLDHAFRAARGRRASDNHAFCADICERPVETRIDPLFGSPRKTSRSACTTRRSPRVPGHAREGLEGGAGVTRVLPPGDARTRPGRPARGLRRRARNLEQHDFPTPYARPDFDRSAALGDPREAEGARRRSTPRASPTTLAHQVTTRIWRVGWGDRAPRGDRRAARLRPGRGRAAPRSSASGSGAGRAPGSSSTRRRGSPVRRCSTVARRRRTSTTCSTAPTPTWRPRFAASSVASSTWYEGDEAKTKLDFLDLLVLTRDLLQRDASVRTELQKRFGALLIDGSQDTDPLQADILLFFMGRRSERGPEPRARVAGSSFSSGDPKQSIYRFRRAGVSFCESIRSRLGKGGASTTAQHSFAPPSIRRS